MSVLLVVCTILLTLAVAWLALEVRLLRCGQVSPALVKIIPALGRIRTYHVGKLAGEAHKDYA